MRIVYAASSIIPSRTANSVHVMRMCEAFARQGHEVMLLAPERPDLYEPGVTDPFDYYGITRAFTLRRLHWTRFRGRRHLFAMLAGVEAVRWNADLVYGRHLLSLCWAQWLGRPVVYETHELFQPVLRLDCLAFRALTRSKRLRYVVTISDALAAALRSKFPEGRIIVARDGACVTDTEELDSASLQATAGEEVGVHSGLHVGYVGHLYPGRGIDVVLDVAAAMPECRFTLVGGTESDIAVWRARARAENVTFVGHVPHREVARICRAFDVLLMPYQRNVAVHGGEGDTAKWMSPLKMFEYMASGRPIVSSDLPVLREILRDGENALLVSPDDPGAWREAIRLLAADIRLRERLGRTAREEVEREYTWDARAAYVLAPLEGIER